MSIDYSPLWYWIKEREAIRIRKEVDKAPPPWSDDSILATYRFCCVCREDDRGTIWIRDHIREPFAGHPLLWLMLCIGRQINWPDTLAELIERDAWPSSEHFEPSMTRTTVIPPHGDVWIEWEDADGKKTVGGPTPECPQTKLVAA